MKLTDIKRLLANAIESNELLNHTNRIKLAAEDQLLPVLEKMVPVYDDKLVSPMAKSIAKEISAIRRNIPADKLFKTIYTATEVVARESALLEKSLSNDNVEAVFREAMNIREGHIVQFIMLADHFIESVRALMVCIQDFEVYHLRGKEPERSMVNYVEKNLNRENLQSIAMLIDFFASKQKEEVISKIYELPEIKIDESVLKTIESTEGRSKIDPAGFNPLNIFNPTFYAFTLKKIWSEIKFYRLDKAKDETEYLELRLQELKLLRDDRHNPALESKIEPYQDSIQKNRIKIERITKRMG